MTSTEKRQNKTTKNSALYETYNLLSVVYKLKGNNEKSVEFRNKYNKVRNFLTQEELSGVNSSIKEIEDKRIALQKKSKNQKIIISGVGLLIILGLFGYYLRQRNINKNQRKSYEAIINHLQEQKISENNSELIYSDDTVESNKTDEYPPEDDEEIKTETNSKKQLISNEMESILLQKLTKFELSNKFTNPNMSLASLAGILGTNTQYLSELINKHKEKNFNVYINELRINYIIKKIIEDKKFTNYKISYLAEESGFSSHSIFSKVFKQLTNISPSEFIKIHKNRKV